MNNLLTVISIFVLILVIRNRSVLGQRTTLNYGINYLLDAFNLNKFTQFLTVDFGAIYAYGVSEAVAFIFPIEFIKCLS